MRMRMLLAIAGASLALNAAAFAQPREGRTKAAVLEAERVGCLAYQENSVAGVRDFLTEDYTLTDSHGTVTTKQDDLDDFLKDRIRYSTFANKNMTVRLYGSTAIVTGQTVVRGTAQGKPFNVEVQFTDTLVYIHGLWKLAAGHVSRLPTVAASSSMSMQEHSLSGPGTRIAIS